MEAPGATGVVQDAGVPLRPSTSITQSRQEPKALMLSVAQSLGISVPASIAARMIDVPSGTVTLFPSMVRVTIFSEVDSGVPKSVSLISVMTATSLGGFKGLLVEVLGEMAKGALYRIRRETA